MLTYSDSVFWRAVSLRSETDAREELFSLTVTARNGVLSAFHIDTGSYGEPAQNTLLGECPRNATALLGVLADNWNHGQVELRVGALDTGHVLIHPRTIEPHETYWEDIQNIDHRESRSYCRELLSAVYILA